MAIESVIELKINGIEQLDELEKRLAGLRDASVNFGGVTAPKGQSEQAHIQRSHNEVHAFSRSLQSAAHGLGNLTMGFVKLSKAILGTGGLLSGVTSMATIAGMLKTAQNINQAAFMTNAIGVNPNDLARLKATYGQVFNVESVYSQVARERAAPYSMLMTQMGISQQQAQMMNPEDLLLMTHQHARRMAQQYGANELALKAGGLEGIMSVDDLQREANLSPGQLREIEQSRQGYRGATQLQQPEDWQRFARMMSLGTQNVGTVMQNLIRPVLDPLFNVFNEFFNRVFGPQNQKMWEEAVEYVRKGLQNLAEFIRTGDWEQLWSKIKTSLEKPLNSITNYIDEHFLPAMVRIENAFNTIANVIELASNAFKSVYDWAVAHHLIMPQAQATELMNKPDALDEMFSKDKSKLTRQAFRTAAEEEVAKRGLPPELAGFLEAQVAQETGNMRSVSSWNFGNITGEYKGKYKVRPDKDRFGRPIAQKFRVYESPQEGISDMLDLLKSSYPEAYGAHTIDEYTAGLVHGKGGRRWAEDPAYREHVKSQYRVKPAPMSGTVSRSLFGNTKVDVTVNAPSSADTTVQTSRTPGAPNTMPR